MQFPKGSGLEVLDRIVRRSVNYYAGAIKSSNLRQNIIRTLKNGPPMALPSIDDLKRPVESFIKGLGEVMSQLTARPEKIDYNAVVGSFLLPGARLLKPRYPEGRQEIQFADLDGDGRDELIASYMISEGVRTIILKKDDVQWCKLAEISNPDYESVHYRGMADLGGDGKKQLILGLVSRQNIRTLFAYSVTDAGAKKIFGRNYDKFELQKTRAASGRIKDAVAFWNEKLRGIYDIEFLHWNGIELEKLNVSRYMAGKVVPYYIRKLRSNPGDAVNWYNLAESLSRAGDANRASAAVDIGLRCNPDELLKERFSELKNRLQA